MIFEISLTNGSLSSVVIFSKPYTGLVDYFIVDRNSKRQNDNI